LDTGTRVRLTSSRRVELERGAVYFDSAADAARSGFEIGTSFGTITDIGTQFEVRLVDRELALRVRVREGEVALGSRPDPQHVAVGEELTVQGTGSSKRGTVEAYGPAWDWVVAAAPRLREESIALDDYLDWYGREMGLRYRYEDDSLARMASAANATGLADLAPDKSLDTAVLAFQLGYRIEDGTLVVTALPAE
jgi:hypothetical protein